MTREKFFRVISFFSVLFLVALVAAAFWFFGTLSKQAEQTQKTVTQLDEKIAKVGERIESSEPRVQKLVKDLEDTQKGIQELKQAVGNTVQAQVAELRHGAHAAQNEIDTLRKELGEVSGHMLKVDSFKAIFHSRNKPAKSAIEFAGGSDWATFQLNPDGRPDYLYPAKFGDKVVAVWWVPIRGLYDFSKWGFITPAPAGNQIRFSGTAGPDAGNIEARIFVLYTTKK